MTRPTILTFAGSAREGSFNKQLARAAALTATDAGADASFLDLRDLSIPLFDQDLEEREGEPAGVTEFKNRLRGADGILIASPEHNSTYSALLKNAIDWASRRREGEAPLECFKDKPAAIVSASPGALGGLRGLTNLRPFLSAIGMLVLPDQLAVSSAHKAFGADGALIGMLVLPDQLAVSSAHKAFGADGALTDPSQADKLKAVVERLVEVAARLK